MNWQALKDFLMHPLVLWPLTLVVVRVWCVLSGTPNTPGGCDDSLDRTQKPGVSGKNQFWDDDDL